MYWCLQALTTPSVSGIAWMFMGYGIFEHQGPGFIGLSNILLSGIQDASNLGHAASHLTDICAATAIMGVSAAGVRTRALCVVVFTVAAVGVPVLARAVWMPVGMTPLMLFLLFLSSSRLTPESLLYLR